MAVNRIVAFGCSNTVGEACSTNWPKELGLLLDCEVVNCAEIGCSGRYIIHAMRHFKFEKDDVCIVAWPEITRYCWLKGEYNFEHIGVWKDSDSTLYKKYFSDYHAEQDFYLYEDYARLYAKQNNITYLDYLSCYTFVNTSKHKMELQDYGTDNKHPGKLSHITFAQQIRKDINDGTVF